MSECSGKAAVSRIFQHGVAERSDALVAGDRALGRPSYFRRKQHGAAAHGHPHTIPSHGESGHRTPEGTYPAHRPQLTHAPGSRRERLFRSYCSIRGFGGPYSTSPRWFCGVYRKLNVDKGRLYIAMCLLKVVLERDKRSAQQKSKLFAGTGRQETCQKVPVTS